MEENKVRIHTRIDESIKARWEYFLLSHHHAIKGGYGPELGRAMEMYMNQFEKIPENNIPQMNMNKTTRDGLRLICIAFRALPTYPSVAPLVVRSVVKNSLSKKDNRSFNGYLKRVVEHLEDHTSDDGTKTKSVKKFCEYVDRLLNENSLK